MADKPILFSAPMVRALLAGTKTQTRRVLSLRGHKAFSQFGPSDTPGYDWHFRDAGMRWHDLRDTELKGGRLRVAVGDRLYVREHWRVPAQHDDIAPRDMPVTMPIQYVASEATRHFVTPGRFRQGMHMPRWASRITLHVTEARVQRLQEIDDADALAEGIVAHADGRYGLPGSGDIATILPCDAYADLWTIINGDKAWWANPWIAAYTFEVERCNIAQARAA